MKCYQIMHMDKIYLGPAVCQIEIDTLSLFPASQTQNTDIQKSATQPLVSQEWCSLPVNPLEDIEKIQDPEMDRPLAEKETKETIQEKELIQEPENDQMDVDESLPMEESKEIPQKPTHILETPAANPLPVLTAEKPILAVTSRPESFKVSQNLIDDTPNTAKSITKESQPLISQSASETISDQAKTCSPQLVDSAPVHLHVNQEELPQETPLRKDQALVSALGVHLVEEQPVAEPSEEAIAPSNMELVGSVPVETVEHVAELEPEPVPVVMNHIDPMNIVQEPHVDLKIEHTSQQSIDPDPQQIPEEIRPEIARANAESAQIIHPPEYVEPPRNMPTDLNEVPTELMKPVRPVTTYGRKSLGLRPSLLLPRPEPPVQTQIKHEGDKVVPPTIPPAENTEKDTAVHEETPVLSSQDELARSAQPSPLPIKIRLHAKPTSLKMKITCSPRIRSAPLNTDTCPNELVDPMSVKEEARTDTESAVETVTKKRMPADAGLEIDLSSSKRRPKRARSKSLDPKLCTADEEEIEQVKKELDEKRVPDVAYRITFSGISDDVIKKKTKWITQHGGIVVDSWQQCTHLVTDRLRRTVKFLCAFASGKKIVDIQWLDMSRDTNRFVDEDAFTLYDSTAEKKFKFDMQASLKKAVASLDAVTGMGRLFQGLKFVIVGSVQPPREEFEELVVSCGGEVNFFALFVSKRWDE